MEGLLSGFVAWMSGGRRVFEGGGRMGAVRKSGSLEGKEMCVLRFWLWQHLTALSRNEQLLHRIIQSGTLILLL